MQVKLPIDAGVVLLDIGFTGDDLNHGMGSLLLLMRYSSVNTCGFWNGLTTISLQASY